MRPVLALLGAAAALVLAGSTAAATVSVIITNKGYNPRNLTIAPGDTVTFANNDTVQHQVVFTPTTGVTCTPNPLVLAAGKTGSCTLATAGKYTFKDATANGKNFQGTITVKAAPGGGGGAVTLTAKPTIVVYGSAVTLSGAQKNVKAPTTVQISAQPCGGGAATTAASTTTAANGSFTIAVRPLLNTAYTAVFGATKSKPVSVQVRPQIKLAKIASHRYSAQVLATASFTGKQASFQRYSVALKRWVRVRKVTLGASHAGAAPTMITVAKFRSGLAHGRLVRLAIAQANSVACYLGGISNTLRS